MIKICGHRLLVKPILIEDSRPEYNKMKELGLVIARDSHEKLREHESVDTGIVLQIGPTAWNDFKCDPWTKIGDTVVYAKGAGKLVIDPEDQEKYIALNDEDIVAITKEV